jgi:hypothetical protein
MPYEQLEPLSDDILVGAAAIAAFIGIDERSARYQIDQGNIPTTRMGRLILSTKSALRRRFTPEEAT